MRLIGEVVEIVSNSIGERMPIRIKARGGESVDGLMRRFKKLCDREGLQKDVKRKEFYEKPSERARRDARKSVVRRMKENGTLPMIGKGPMPKGGKGPLAKKGAAGKEMAGGPAISEGDYGQHRKQPARSGGPHPARLCLGPARCKQCHAFGC